MRAPVICLSAWREYRTLSGPCLTVLALTIPASLSSRNPVIRGLLLVRRPERIIAFSGAEGRQPRRVGQARRRGRPVPVAGPRERRRRSAWSRKVPTEDGPLAGKPL